MSDDTFVLGNGIERRDRVTKSGATKSRYTVSIRSEKLIFNLSEKALSKPTAEAIKKLIQERIAGISDQAAPNTIKARQVAAKAVSLGKAWAVKRYSGGKTGALPPNQSTALFNDSGRFWRAMSAAWVGEGSAGRWVINFAANRLSPGTLDGKGGGDSVVLQIWERLKGLVPELGNMDLIADSIPVRAAMQKSLETMIQKTSSEGWEAAVSIVENVVSFVQGVDEMLAAG